MPFLIVLEVRSAASLIAPTHFNLKVPECSHILRSQGPGLQHAGGEDKIQPVTLTNGLVSVLHPLRHVLEIPDA